MVKQSKPIAEMFEDDLDAIMQKYVNDYGMTYLEIAGALSIFLFRVHAGNTFDCECADGE